MISTSVCIHMQPSAIDSINNLKLDWDYSKQHGTEEIDVYVDDVPYEIVDGTYQDPDVQLCDFYGIDYDLVNMIESA